MAWNFFQGCGAGESVLMLEDIKDTARLTLAFDVSYAAGNLFKDIAKSDEQLN